MKRKKVDGEGDGNQLNKMESFHVCNNLYTQYTPLDPIASEWDETKINYTCKLRLNTGCKFKYKMQHRDRNEEKTQYFSLTFKSIHCFKSMYPKCKRNTHTYTIHDYDQYFEFSVLNYFYF